MLVFSNDSQRTWLGYCASLTSEGEDETPSWAPGQLKVTHHRRHPQPAYDSALQMSCPKLGSLVSDKLVYLNFIVCIAYSSH
jgi:hypothetical protein